MNPFGKMPTLEHDGRYIIESEVICQYLEDLYPTPTILPGDALARAHARNVSRVVDLYVWPDANLLFHEQLVPWSARCNCHPGQQGPTGHDVCHYRRAVGGRAVGGWGVLAGGLQLVDARRHDADDDCAAFGVANPADAGPKLAAWWSLANADPFTSAFVAEMRAATNTYLATLASGHSTS